MYLLDTNIISELRKGNRADVGIQQFFQSAIEQNFRLRILPVSVILLSSTMPAMSTSYSMSFVCFECCKAFKREYQIGSGIRELPCPQCGSTAHNLGRHFKPPKRRDAKQWDKVNFLFEHGFRFQKIRIGGHHDTVPYPKTLEEARDFVVRYKDYAVSDTD